MGEKSPNLVILTGNSKFCTMIKVVWSGVWGRFLNMPLGANFDPQGFSCPLRVKILCFPLVLSDVFYVKRSHLRVNIGLDISPRGQSSPLRAIKLMKTFAGAYFEMIRMLPRSGSDKFDGRQFLLPSRDFGSRHSGRNYWIMTELWGQSYKFY
jgi:hypothetical protein